MSASRSRRFGFQPSLAFKDLMNSFTVILAIVLLACASASCEAQNQRATDAPSATGPHISHPASLFRPSAPGFEPRRRSDAQGVEYAGAFSVYRAELEKTRVVLRDQHGSVAIEYAGARPEVRIEPAELQKATRSWFPTSDPSTWERNLPSFGRVNYRELYRGIDLSFYSRGGRLEYDFAAQPGSKPESIRLLMDGVDNLTVNAAGDLVFTRGKSKFTLLKPVAYQPEFSEPGRDAVEVRYVVRRLRSSGAKTVEFRLGRYDRSRPLVIDPVLVYGIYLPGQAGISFSGYFADGTSISAMQADAAGNTYVVGDQYNQLSEPGLPIYKFNSAGELVWSVSLGGEDAAPISSAVAIGASGEVFLAGTAFAGLPTTQGGFQPASASTQLSGYLAAISPDGSTLDYATYLGGTGGSTTSIDSAAVDAAGNVYAAGETNAAGFPTTANAYLPSAGLQNAAASYVFVSKFNTSLSGSSSLVYSTLVEQAGGYGQVSVAVDSSANAYIAAGCESGSPVTNGAFAFRDIASAGACLSKLNPTASGLIYSAYLGPGTPAAVAVDGSGAAYVAGAVVDDDFPVTAGAYRTDYPGGFALKLSADGGNLVYSTFLGGPSGASGGVNPTSVAIAPGCASNCSLAIAGTTTTSDFPLIAPMQAAPAVGPLPANFSTGFLVEIAPAGSTAAFSTYLGGDQSSTSPVVSTPAVSEDKAGNLYFASNIQGFDAPVTRPAIINAAGGFLARISPASGAAVVAVPSQVEFLQSVVGSTVSLSGAVELRNLGSAALALKRPFEFSAKDFAEKDNCPSTLPAGGSCSVNLSFTPVESGTRTGTMKVNSASGGSASVSLSGQGLDGYNLESSPATVNFGDVVLGKSSAAVTVMIENHGDRPLPIAAVSPNLPDYVVENHCPAKIAPGDKCALSVSFHPTQIGLRSGSIFVQIPGSTFIDGYTYLDGYYIPVTGTGLKAANGTGDLQVSQSTYNFGELVVGETSTAVISLLNSGPAPVTINGISMVAGKSSAPGDFQLFLPPSPDYYYYEDCAVDFGASPPVFVFPISLQPQSSCDIEVVFRPSIADSETATVSISDSAATGPRTIVFTGIGLQSAHTLTVLPSALTFPAQPVGVASAPQTYLVLNAANDTVAIDRIGTTGDFLVDDEVNSGCNGARLGPQASCSISVAFLPTATGARTGTLMLTDTSTGKPQTFSLAGTGIAATGTLTASTETLAFGAQAQGTTGAEQELMFSNPGNSTVTLNSFTTTAGFAVVNPGYAYNSPPAACATTLAAESTCQVSVVFSPTTAGGAETGILTAHSSAGDVTVQLSGTSVAGTTSLAVYPPSANFGPTIEASPNQNYSYITFFLVNTGSEPITFPDPLTISNPDFSIDSGNCEIPSSPGPSAGTIAPGANCSITAQFMPSTTKAESAILAFATSAGTQQIALSGTGTSSLPSITVAPTTYAFDPVPVGSNSGINDYSNEVLIYNNGTSPVTISSVAITSGSSDFLVSTQFLGCANQTIPAGSYCSAPLMFQPSAAGYRTGVVTIKDSNGNSYTENLAGYATPAFDAASVAPQVLAFPASIAPPGAAAGSPVYYGILISNTGSRSLTIGTIAGTDVSSTGDFVFGANGNCSGNIVSAGSSCQLVLGFTPQSLGSKTGSLTIPITYADNSTATLTVDLSGLGVAATPAAAISPANLAFPPVVVGQTQETYSVNNAIIVNNTGNETFTVGTVTGTNLTATAGQGGDFYFTPQYYQSPVAPGLGFLIGFTFQPQAVGSRSGSVSIPVTFADGSKTTFTALLTGTGVKPAPAIVLSATQLNFEPQVAGGSIADYATGVDERSVLLTNTGNALATIKSIRVSSNFSIVNPGCYPGITGGSCEITVQFTPAAATPVGTTTGTLTIVDNAPGSPHTVKLVGQTISPSHALELSQTTLNLGSQAAGTTGQPQAVYLTNQSANEVVVDKLALVGTDPADFVMTQTCGGSLGFAIPGEFPCLISAAFSPRKTSTGTRKAEIVIVPAAGTPLSIQLSGTVAP